MFRENPGETEAKLSPFPKEPATGVIKQRQRGRKCNMGTDGGAGNIPPAPQDRAEERSFIKYTLPGSVFSRPPSDL